MITRNIEVPTGNICVMKGDYGNLEFLSIGDYGTDANIKADFLGIARELNGVPNGEIMPLSEKWVITISTQYGCSMSCKFCDVPKVGAGVNATVDDLRRQIELAISLHPEIKTTKRLNLHYARMGEPTWNGAVLYNARMLRHIIYPLLDKPLIHPVISTMMPKNNKILIAFLHDWIFLKNNIYHGDAGLQLSINSTDESRRSEMFSGNAETLEEISAIFKCLPTPEGRKYALNFALADNYIVDAEKLRRLFPTDKFMVKITPLHATNSCKANAIQTTGGYKSFVPYADVEKRLKDVGFDVLVFIPSADEDESLITCGNAILSGTLPRTQFKELAV